MTILLDSHAFIWWAIDDRKLSRTAHEAIATEAAFYISAVVAWEITNKVRSGKWPEAAQVAGDFFAVVSGYGFYLHPISPEHAHLAGSMQGRHRDPFDRMLAAQARIDGMTMITADSAFREFGIGVLW